MVKSILLFGHWHKLEQTKTCDRNHFMTCLHQFHQIISKSKQINWNHESPIPETIMTTNHREILHRYACIFKLTSKEQHNNVAILTTLIKKSECSLTKTLSTNIHYSFVSKVKSDDIFHFCFRGSSCCWWVQKGHWIISPCLEWV